MLTEKRIKTLAPPAGVGELNVRDEPGLVLRVRRNADGSISRSWAFWRVRGGRRERAKIGAWPAIDLTEARRQADHYRKLAERGVRVTKEVAPSTAASTPTTFGDLCDVWHQLYAAPRHKDKGARAQWLLTKHAAVIRSVPLAALTKQHITMTVLPLVGRGHAKTAGDLFQVIRQVCAFGTRHDFLAADPAGALKRSDLVPPKNAPRDRVLSDAELRALAAASVLKQRVGPAGREFELFAVPPHAALAMWAQLATAARPGEIGAALWKHVDLKAGTWTIPGAHSKNARSHTVALSPFAQGCFGLLREVAGDDPRVVSMGRAALSRAVKDRQRTDKRRSPTKRAHSDALALAGGPWTLHDLRRTAATLMAEEGVQPHIVERCLNHVQPTLIRTYQRADYADEQREAFRVLGRRLQRLAPKLLPALRKELALGRS